MITRGIISLMLVMTLLPLGAFLSYAPGVEGASLEEHGYSQGMAAPAAASEIISLKEIGRWNFRPAPTVAAGRKDGVPYAFLGSGTSVLAVDLSDPARPTQVDELTLRNTVESLALSGKILLVANQRSGLRVVDVSNPHRMAEVGFVSAIKIRPEMITKLCGYRVCTDNIDEDRGQALDVAVTGNLALVAEYVGGLRIIDISRPGVPREVGAIRSLRTARAVAVSGKLALVVNRSDGLHIIDISDPAYPVEVSFYPISGQPQRVAVAGDLALVANGVDGLWVIDISNPATPAAVAFYTTPGRTWGVAAAGSLALVASKSDGLRAFDLRDLAQKEDVASFIKPRGASDVAVLGNMVLVADGFDGLYILSLPTIPSLPAPEEGIIQTGLGAVTIPTTPVEEGLAPLLSSNRLVRVWSFDGATQSFQLYDPETPALSDLEELVPGRGYWVKVKETGTVTLGSNTYQLFEGWNLVGWQG
jgi:hypothetical protein